MKPTVLDRLWAKTMKAGADECWMWTGGVGGKGQPRSTVGESTFSPRRYVYECYVGPIPEKRHVSNTCHQARCLNPAHMTLKIFGGDVEERLWSQVKKTDDDGCWEWTGFLTKGYATIRAYGKNIRVSRLVWEFTNGPIVGHVPHTKDYEICLCHKCDNPKCCRPDHLFLGSDADNMADMTAKGRRATGARTRGNARTVRVSETAIAEEKKR